MQPHASDAASHEEGESGEGGGGRREVQELSITSKRSQRCA